MTEIDVEVHKVFGPGGRDNKPATVARVAFGIEDMLDMGGNPDVVARQASEDARRKRLRDFLALDELDKEYGGEGIPNAPGYTFLPVYGRVNREKYARARQATMASKWDEDDDKTSDESVRLTPSQIAFRRVLAKLEEQLHHEVRPGGMVWTPVAGGVARDRCGEVNKCREARCSSGEDHGKIAFIQHDYDYKCPVCYRYACIREARKITEKIKAIAMAYAMKKQRLGRLYHVVLSPPGGEYWRFDTKDGLDGLFDQLGKFFELLGIVGAVTIIHRYRKTHDTEDSWHFHVLCWLPRGQQVETAKFEAATGWTYVNLGKRETIFGTAHYQLTHAVVPEYMKDDGQLGRAQMVRYFGVLANGNAKKTVTVTQKVHRCRQCTLDFHDYVDLQGTGHCDHDVGKHWVKTKKARYSLKPHRTPSGRIIDYFARFLNRWAVMMSMDYKRIDVKPDATV